MRIVLDLSKVVKGTTAITQARAKHVIARARHATIMILSLPCPITATVKSEVLSMNTDSPQAKRNQERAPVGGRVGRVERGVSNHRKKYARHRINANTASRLPRKEWI